MAGRCGLCSAGRTFHPDCALAALSWAYRGEFDIQIVRGPVLRLAPRCYLCGVADSVELEHVQPKATGGSDTWANAGAACRPCNRVKGSRTLMEQLAPEQVARWEAQQAAYQKAFNASSRALAYEALAVRATKKTYPSGDAYADMDSSLMMMRIYCCEAEIPASEMGPWLRGGVEAMLAARRIAPVPEWPLGEAVAEHVALEVDDQRRHAALHGADVPAAGQR